jgi:hypothetical protein
MQQVVIVISGMLDGEMFRREQLKYPAKRKIDLICKKIGTHRDCLKSCSIICYFSWKSVFRQYLFLLSNLRPSNVNTFLSVFPKPQIYLRF